MKDFAGRVAVVTGGASGIGRALAEAFAKRGMKIVIADMSQSNLDETAEALRASGTEVMPVRLDVRERDALAQLAEDVVARYGGAHVLCNNAGVGHSGFMHELTLEEWDWVIDVNLKSVVYGIHAFLPHMRKSGQPCHILNTASMAGLVSSAGMGPYNATKFAVVAVSETLAAECVGSNIGVSVLCPGWVSTRILDDERYLPESIARLSRSDLIQAMTEEVRKLINEGMKPADVAERVIAAIESGSLYVLTHPEMMPFIEERFRRIMTARP